MRKQKNVLGEDLESCSTDPMTGWFRDGCCNTNKDDTGVHTVCAKVSEEFLEWCKEAFTQNREQDPMLSGDPDQVLMRY